MDTVTIVHPTGAPDVLGYEERESAEIVVAHCIARCKASVGVRTIQRSWAEDIVIEGVKSVKKKKK